MSWPYLGNLAWSEISREERFFCQELYQRIKGNEHAFVKFLGEHGNLKLIDAAHWECGYEVCLYRDARNKLEKVSRDPKYSNKRTFDLCLFSESTIIIIEAKAQQLFKSDQINQIKFDKTNIPYFLLAPYLSVKTVALASSIYLKNQMKFGKNEILKDFDSLVSWRDVYSKFCNEEIFLQADESYKK